MYTERLTFFIDILGFKEIIEKTETDSSLIESLFNVLISVTSENLKLGVTGNINHEIIPEEEKEKALAIMKEFSESIIKQLDIKATQFSDCLVFSVPVENEMACFSIFEAIAKLMTKLHAEYNLLLRGGVSIGKICHEEGGPLFGPALVEAYEIESKQAVYPRVLLSKDVAKGVLRTQMHKFMLSLFEKEEDDLYISLATAYYYLIHESTVFNKEQLRKNFFLSKKAIYEQIDLVKVEKVKKKYQWLYLKMEKMESKISTR
ncbi:hypothetical protein [Hydrogenimonas thermophila]|uniref:Uncharacterized protein n=1 Tax=Hydrogenimonas thermophila TaxID=223786 RepID=A0A1I5U2G2_9BACT|nr:hypothetical protein [Hydrogenimonas thermophila]SFP88766.1 hypothetical protein SAMN05216234_1529 [Hydrogenimonas thermophila]